jgi:hypothetical protein
LNGHFSGLANRYSFRLRPVASPGPDAAARLAAVARDLARQTRRVTLSGLPQGDGSADLAEAAFREAGGIALRRPCDTNHVLHLQGRSYDEYLAARPEPSAHDEEARPVIRLDLLRPGAP